MSDTPAQPGSGEGWRYWRIRFEMTGSEAARVRAKSREEAEVAYLNGDPIGTYLAEEVVDEDGSARGGAPEVASRPTALSAARSASVAEMEGPMSADRTTTPAQPSGEGVDVAEAVRRARAFATDDGASDLEGALARAVLTLHAECERLRGEVSELRRDNSTLRARIRSRPSPEAARKWAAESAKDFADRVRTVEDDVARWIVAWLRNGPDITSPDSMLHIANAIERGDWRPAQQPQGTGEESDDE